MNIFMLQSVPPPLAPPPPPGLAIDTHIWILFSLAIAYGIYIIVKKKRSLIKL